MPSDPKTGWGRAYRCWRVTCGKKTLFRGSKGACREFIRKSNRGGLRLMPPNA